MTSSPAERIAESFNSYFGGFSIRLAPGDVVPGSHRTIGDEKSGWRITFRVDHDDEFGLPSLEFYATNRWTNDRWVRIGADGRQEHMEGISEIVFDEADEERNAEIERVLRDRGLY